MGFATPKNRVWALREVANASSKSPFPVQSRLLLPKPRLFPVMPKPKSPAKAKAAAPESDGANGVESTPVSAASGNGKEAANPVAGTQDVTTSVSKYLLSGGQKNEDAADAKLTPFNRSQKKRLLALRDAMLDSMNGVAQDNLRARAESNEASAFGMHQADAGSDAYDRDFALNLLSQEQDALYEIDEALKRIELGTYGTCEMSGKPINKERLEAIPLPGSPWNVSRRSSARTRRSASVSPSRASSV